MLVIEDSKSETTAELVSLTRDISSRHLAPLVDSAEEQENFPRETFTLLGETGLLGLPYSEEYGGGSLDAEQYLQVFEELGRTWASVAVGVSVHALSCFPLATYGTDEQKAKWLPWMLEGESLGAYCLSEAHAGSDPAAMRTRAERVEGGYILRGTKAWVTHGGKADFYTVMARTSDDPRTGISCFFVPADTPGINAAPPERKMGLTGSTTASINFDGVFVSTQHRIGEEGSGLKIALSALDSGRLGIAAIATGLAQAALDQAVAYAQERDTFGTPIIKHQGVSFLLADMDVAIESARATYRAAARRRDQGLPFTREAAISKLLATDAAMKVTTDSVQVLGGAGYTKDFPVERYMREAKIMQIFEGTNQIQRIVIARQLEQN